MEETRWKHHETPFYLFLFEIYLKGKTRSNPSCPGIEDSEVATLWPQGAKNVMSMGTSPGFFGGQGSKDPTYGCSTQQDLDHVEIC